MISDLPISSKNSTLKMPPNISNFKTIPPDSPQSLEETSNDSLFSDVESTQALSFMNSTNLSPSFSDPSSNDSLLTEINLIEKNSKCEETLTKAEISNLFLNITKMTRKSRRSRIALSTLDNDLILFDQKRKSRSIHLPTKQIIYSHKNESAETLSFVNSTNSSPSFSDPSSNDSLSTKINLIGKSSKSDKTLTKVEISNLFLNITKMIRKSRRSRIVLSTLDNDLILFDQKRKSRIIHLPTKQIISSHKNESTADDNDGCTKYCNENIFNTIERAKHSIEDLESILKQSADKRKAVKGKSDSKYIRKGRSKTIITSPGRRTLRVTKMIQNKLIQTIKIPEKQPDKTINYSIKNNLPQPSKPISLRLKARILKDQRLTKI